MPVCGEELCWPTEALITDAPEASRSLQDAWCSWGGGSREGGLAPILGGPHTSLSLLRSIGAAQTTLRTNDHFQLHLWPLWWPLR